MEMKKGFFSILKTLQRFDRSVRMLIFRREVKSPDFKERVHLEFRAVEQKL